MNRGLYTFIIVTLFLALPNMQLLRAQESEKLFTVNGSLQTDILFPEEDKAIGTEKYKEWALTNTYLDLGIRSKYVEAGGRFEYMKFPLPGFEPDFKGWGVPYFYVTGIYKNIKLTAGDFYEQFGNGLILKTYQERSLGIDNALRGGRLLYQPFEGVNIKLLGGKQRYYFSHNDSFIWGGDAEFELSQWLKRMQQSNTYLSLGVSYVGKHEKDEIIMSDISDTLRLNLPINVGAFAVRMKLQKGNFNVMTEYAYKGNDPSFDNGYIYKPGSALLLSGSYSKRGMSALLQVKRSDNMSFRSVRTAPSALGDKSTISSTLNHLPAFTQQQTYMLGTLYPYATQANGEWAFQGEFGYTFAKGTSLGGKYGTKIKLNVSHIRSLDKKNFDEGSVLKGSDGYKSPFFKMGGEIYYQDYVLNIDKKVSSDVAFNFMYMYQYFNQWVIKKEITDGGNKIVKSNLFVLENKYKMSKKLSLRSEVQYLTTKQDEGDWIAGLVELSVLPSLMFTVSDMYNIGKTNLNYYGASVTYSRNAHRLQVGYSRNRAGYNCSGGVCRTVPASKGVQVSYNYNF